LNKVIKYHKEIEGKTSLENILNNDILIYNIKNYTQGFTIQRMRRIAQKRTLR